MRYTAEHKERTFQKILAATGRGFRRAGFGGIGIDGLASGAKVTSGAFYGHFKSKADAFRAAVVVGLEDLRRGIVGFRTSSGARWLRDFADFYFGERVTCDLADGCALPSLSGDVARSDAKTKRAYERELARIVDAIADGLPADDRLDPDARAIALVALFAGGVTVARSVQDPALRERITSALRKAAIELGDGRHER